VGDKDGNKTSLGLYFLATFLREMRETELTGVSLQKSWHAESHRQ